jgi:hypothetical protein
MRPLKVALVHEQLATSETTEEHLQQVNSTISDELRKKKNDLERTTDNCFRLRGRTSKLSKEVKRLRVKVLRAPGQSFLAVETALARAANKSGGQPDIWRIKRDDGRIKDWVRDLTCKLICIRHVPASQTPGVISDVVRAFKTHVDGHDGPDNEDSDVGVNRGDVETFSDRSARRFPVEGHVMEHIQVAKEFKAALG